MGRKRILGRVSLRFAGRATRVSHINPAKKAHQFAPAGPDHRVVSDVFVYAKVTVALRRRLRIEPSTMPKPPIIIAQVTGSGTAPVVGDDRTCANVEQSTVDALCEVIEIVGGIGIEQSEGQRSAAQRVDDSCEEPSLRPEQ